MATIRILGLIAAMMSAAFAAPAYACPGGYVACGGACCPR
jgi:hypothetical protein